MNYPVYNDIHVLVNNIYMYVDEYEIYCRVTNINHIENVINIISKPESSSKNSNKIPTSLHIMYLDNIKVKTRKI